MIREIVKDTEFLSKKLKDANLKRDAQIIADLIDTANNYKDNCAGLAANQIGYDKRIIVYRKGDNYIPMINPFITKKSKLTEIKEEGCLSLDGIREVKRHVWVEVMWINQKGKPVKSIFKGFTAEVIQHEIDHLNGKLI